MLIHLGYSPEYASDGSKGEELFRKAASSGEPFGLVITDLTIPGSLSGVEIKDLLRTIDPGVRVIVASGYSNKPFMADYLRYGFDEAIPKPFVLRAVASAIHRVLGKSS